MLLSLRVMVKASRACNEKLGKLAWLVGKLRKEKEG